MIYACRWASGWRARLQSPPTGLADVAGDPAGALHERRDMGERRLASSGILGPALGGLVIALARRRRLVYAIVAWALLLVAAADDADPSAYVARSEEELSCRFSPGLRFI